MTSVRRALSAGKRRLAGSAEPAPAQRPEPATVKRPKGPPPPPPPRPGHVAAPPDFVGVGTMKSGSSWWTQLIAAHPAVTPPMKNARPAKEMHFFDQFSDRPFTDEDRETYWKYFARPPGTMSGEWTPGYAVDFWTMPLLKAAAPDAKMLFLVRDPIDRYRSGIQHSSQRDWFETSWLSRDHFQRGLYHWQLSWILEHYPPEQVLVLQLEQCMRNTEAEIKRTYDFLGLDSSFVPNVAAAGTNKSTVAPVVLPDHVVSALRKLYHEDATALFAAVPELDPTLWVKTLGEAPQAS